MQCLVSLLKLFVTRHLGSSLPWWAYAALMQMVVIGLGIAKVEIGGKVLGVLMLLEIAIVFADGCSLYGSTSDLGVLALFNPVRF